MSEGWNEEVSKCCNASVRWGGSYGSFFKECTLCGKSLDYPNGYFTKFVYHPSDYEKSLEQRIAALEKKSP